MSKLYLENSTFGIIMSWSGQVRSGRVNVLLVFGGSGRASADKPISRSNRERRLTFRRAKQRPTRLLCDSEQIVYLLN